LGISLHQNTGILVQNTQTYSDMGADDITAESWTWKALWEGVGRCGMEVLIESLRGWEWWVT
jgi:hypothetical protein